MSFTIPLDLHKDYDEKGLIKGFIEKDSITIYEEDDEDSYSDPDKKGFKLYQTPCLVLKTYDEETSEAVGFASLKDVGTEIPITNEQLTFLKKIIAKHEE